MGQMTKPLERYALILEVLSRFPGGQSLTEISGLSQLPKATTHRIINSLVNIGYVSGGNGRVAFRLEPRLLRMMHFGKAPTWFGPLVEPIQTEGIETFYSVGLVGLQPRLSNFPRQNLVAGFRTASERIAKLLRSRRTHPSHEAAPSVLGEDR